MTRSQVAIVSCVVVCAAWACTRAAAPVLGKMTIEVNRATSAGLTDARVRTAVEAELTRGALFQLAPVGTRAGPSLRVQVWFDEGPGATGLVRVRGALGTGDVQTVEDEDAPVSGSPASLDERAVATEPALQKAARAVFVRLRAVSDARSKSRDALLADVKSADPVVSVAALVVLTELGDRRAVGGWKAELAVDDVRRVHRAIGALVELKAQEAVAALIETAGPRDEVLHREILFALAALGGDEAAAYLSMVAENHDHPILRNSAKLALEELQAARQASDAGRK